MRKLTFSRVMILLLQKSQKSLQLVLNEFYDKLDIDEPATAGAFTQARANLRYTALIELNQKGVVEVMYRDDDIHTHQFKPQGSKYNINVSHVFGCFRREF